MTLSVSIFVPKASTPFQWFGAQTESDLRLKLERLNKQVKRLRAVRFIPPSVRSSMLEAAVSRGSWKTAHALHKLVFESLSPRKAWEKVGLSLAREASEPVPAGAQFPWEHVYPVETRAELEAGYTKACDDM